MYGYLLMFLVSLGHVKNGIFIQLLVNAVLNYYGKQNKQNKAKTTKLFLKLCQREGPDFH